MDKSMILKIAGVVGLIGGCACLYLAGISESTVSAVVSGVFVLGAAIASVFGFGKSK